MSYHVLNFAGDGRQLRAQTDHVLDVDLKRDTAAGLLVEVADIANAFENVSAQVLLDKEQDYVALSFHIEAQKSLCRFEASPTRTGNDSRTRRASLPRRPHNSLSLVLIDKRDNQFEFHLGVS